MTKRIAKFFSLALVALFMNQQVNAQGLEVSPVRLAFDLEASSTQTETITVRNTSSKKEIYTIGTADWYLDEIGDIVRQDAGENANSCADWMTFTPALVELEPNESAQVQVTLNVPSGESISKWALINVTRQEEQTAPQADQDLTMGIIFNQQISVLVTQDPISNKNAVAKISKFGEAQSAEGKRAFEVTAENSGEKILDCMMFLMISNMETAEERKLDPIAFRVLPGGKRDAQLELPADLAKGNYLVAAVLDFGPDYPLEGAQMEIEVK